MEIRRLLAESMQLWQVVLLSGGKSLGEVNIKQGIF